MAVALCPPLNDEVAVDVGNGNSVKPFVGVAVGVVGVLVAVGVFVKDALGVLAPTTSESSVGVGVLVEELFWVGVAAVVPTGLATCVGFTVAVVCTDPVDVGAGVPAPVVAGRLVDAAVASGFAVVG